MLEGYAKAIEETAKATSKAIDAAQSLGRFIGRHIDAPLEQVMGLATDRVKYMRASNMIDFHEKLQRQSQLNGGIKNLQKLPLNFALDALEQALMEDEAELQDIWARLLINTVDVDSKAEPRRAYISIIRDLSRIDAIVLEQIYRVDQEKDRKAIVTYELPSRAYAAIDIDLKTLPQPNEEIQESLANLERLRLISFGASWGGGHALNLVNQTVAGKAFMRAISPRHV